MTPSPTLPTTKVRGKLRTYDCPDLAKVDYHLTMLQVRKGTELPEVVQSVHHDVDLLLQRRLELMNLETTCPAS